MENLNDRLLPAVECDAFSVPAIPAIEVLGEKLPIERLSWPRVFFVAVFARSAFLSQRNAAQHAHRLLCYEIFAEMLFAVQSGPRYFTGIKRFMGVVSLSSYSLKRRFLMGRKRASTHGLTAHRRYALALQEEIVTRRSLEPTNHSGAYFDKLSSALTHLL